MAVQVLLLFIVTEASEQSAFPLQPTNVEPALAVAVIVPTVLYVYVPAPVTVPVPVPAVVIESTYVHVFAGVDAEHEPLH